MAPDSPKPPTRPERDTLGELLSEDKLAERAAVERTPVLTRFKLQREERRKQALLRNGSLPLHVTKPTSHQPLMKLDRETTQSKATAQAVEDLQPQHMAQPQNAAIEIRPQLDRSNPPPKAESLTSVARPLIKEAAEHASIQRKRLRVYQNRAKPQALEFQNVYQLSGDNTNNSKPSHIGPRASSSGCPSDSHTPGSPESETLEQCVKSVFRAKTALDKGPQRENTSQINRNASDDEKNAVERHLHTSLHDESLDESNAAILNLPSDERILASLKSPSLSIPKRPRSSAHNELTDFRTDDNGDENESSENFRAPPSKKRQRSDHRNVETARNEVLQAALASRRRSNLTFTRPHGKSARNESRQPHKPKKGRCLPVNELVTGPHRLQDRDLNDHNSKLQSMLVRYPLIKAGPPLELSQDPISQVSEGSFRIHSKVSIKFKVLARPGKGIGHIDVSEFRLPDRPSPRYRHNGLRRPSYSDGFEGNEAKPIGWTMPVKGPTRHKEVRQKITIKIPALTIITEMQPSSLNPATICRQRKKKRQFAVAPQAPTQAETHRDSLGSLRDDQIQGAKQLGPDETHDDTFGTRQTSEAHHPVIEEQNDPIQIADQPELGEAPSNKPNKHPATSALLSLSTPLLLPSDDKDFEHHASTTSPLKRKQEHKFPDRRDIRKTIKFSKGPGKIDSVEKYRPVSHILAWTPKKNLKQIRAELEAMHELSMVSVARRQLLSDDEDESANEEEEEDEDSHSRDDNDCSSSAESYEDPTEATSDVSGSDWSTEQESDKGHIEQELKDLEQSLDSNSKEQDGDLLPLVQEDGIDDYASGEHLDVRSLQNPARWVPASGATDKATRSQNESGPLVLLQEEDMLAEDQRLGPDKCYKGQRHRSSTPPRYNYSLDSSWRPRAPHSSSIPMEVDEEIHDSPPQSSSHVRLEKRIYPTRHRSRIASRPLPLAHSRPESPISQNSPADQHGSQGSTILGETQNFVLPEVSIPETQLYDKPEVPRSQVYDASSYLSQASQDLKKPVHKLRLSRTRSSPAHVIFEQAQTSVSLIPPSTVFRINVSPFKSAARLPSLLEKNPTPAPGLNALTRKASIGMGTMPVSASRRMMSAPWKPPFKNASIGVRSTLA
ncbi:hypothetical protein EG329_009019 [Mollisiaceae sp. DMI_Dod_QoI]|nr:hypothetical protein EG329_009019 [Helotiales sp. DMI_Dod_QoI]